MSNFYSTPEFDPYGPRNENCYFGSWWKDGGLDIQWPSREAPKVFAYLRAARGIEILLNTLAELRWPIIAYVSDLPPGLSSRYAESTIRFLDRPANVSTLLPQCDIVICHGNLATTSQSLLAGKPLLLLPRILEHRLNSERAAELNAAVLAPFDSGELLTRQLLRLMNDDNHRLAAQAFSAKHRNHDQGQQIARACDALEASAKS